MSAAQLALFLWPFAASVTKSLLVHRSEDCPPCNMADTGAPSRESGSDPTGVDITRTGVHDSPFQDAASDDDVSVQSDFAAGMDISYQAPSPRNIEAFLAPQGRDGSDNSSAPQVSSREFCTHSLSLSLSHRQIDLSSTVSCCSFSGCLGVSSRS